MRLADTLKETSQKNVEPSSPAVDVWDDLESFVSCMAMAIKQPSRSPLTGEILATMGAQGDVLRLSLVAMLAKNGHADKTDLTRIVQFCRGVENESMLHTAVLYYKAMALRKLDMPSSALEIIDECLLELSGRPCELELALRYERALCCDVLGMASHSKRELKKIFSMAPDYRDVATRLGL